MNSSSEGPLVCFDRRDIPWLQLSRAACYRGVGMERKIFWACFTVLGLAADLFLPFWWAVGATLPIILFSWWVAYRSGWF